MILSLGFHRQMALAKAQRGSETVGGFPTVIILQLFLVLLDALVVSVNLVRLVFFAYEKEEEE